MRSKMGLSLTACTIILICLCSCNSRLSEHQNEMRIVIETDSEIGFLYDGLAVFGEENSFGYINEDGELKIPLQFEEALGFFDGFACVRKDGKYGFIDKDGNVVIPFRYNEPFSFCQGIASVKSGEDYFLMDKMEKVLSKGYHQIRINPSYDYGITNLIPVSMNGKWGFINTDGEEIIPIIYDEAEEFYEGISATVVDGKYGYINQQNEIVIPHVYDSLDKYKCTDNRVIVRTGGYFDTKARAGVLDRENNIVIPFNYTSIEYNNTDKLFICTMNKISDVYDISGKLLNTFDGDVTFAYENKYVLLTEDKYILLNDRGKNISETEFDYCSKYYDGLCRVGVGGKYGYANLNGKIIIPVVFDECSDFLDGLAIVKKDGCYGIIDTMGRYLVSPEKQGIFRYQNQFLLKGDRTILTAVRQGTRVIGDVRLSKNKFFQLAFSVMEWCGVVEDVPVLTHF